MLAVGWPASFPRFVRACVRDMLAGQNKNRGCGYFANSPRSRRVYESHIYVAGALGGCLEGCYRKVAAVRDLPSSAVYGIGRFLAGAKP